jgi:tetratricopeptide (TPR) repeat protein
VRITAHLVRADTGENLWTGSYDREGRDVLTLQSEVAQVIAAQILARVTPAARARLRDQPTIPPEAYESYLKARFYLNSRTRNRKNLEESVRFFQETIDRDPTFAPAYAGLASAHQAFGSTSSGGSPVADSWPKVIAAATKALDLNPQLAEAHSILAHTYQQQWRWADAEEGYRRALEADPNDASAHLDFGGLLTWLGRTEEGLAHARRGRALDPLSTGSTVQLAWILYHARRYDAAIDELRNVLIAEPERGDALWFLGFALTDASRPAEAIQTLEHLAEVWSRSSASLGVLTRAYARAGRLAEAHQIVEELERRSRAGYVPPAVFVNAYVGINDRDRAFRALERAYNEHSNIMTSLTTHPLYDPLRDDPRFAALLRRVGLN